MQIYVHGLGQSPKSWEKVISLLGTEEETVCPDLSELIQGKEVTYQNLFEAFSAVCNEYNGRIKLCGLSLGGVLALNYTLVHPEKVERLVLIAAQYKMPVNLLKFQNMLFQWMPRSMFRQTGFKKKAFLSLCRSMMDLDFSGSLDRISSPVLLICGEKDFVNRKASLKLAACLKDAVYQELKGAGHEANLEAAENLAFVITRFFEP